MLKPDHLPQIHQFHQTTRSKNMSILGGNSDVPPIFRELKKQASFFLKEKIKTARLALTDVTPAQLMTEEATNGDPGGALPDAQTLKMISKAAFEVDDYWRIVDILHKRLLRFDERNWRSSYNTVVVLEHLLTHGPERIAEEFQCHQDVIKQMQTFHHLDDTGFNWGVSVRNKSERVLKMLEKGPLLKEERNKARKISRGIQGFGSFCLRSSSPSSPDQQHLFSSSAPDNGTISTTQVADASSKENLAPNHEGSWEPVHESKSLLDNQHKESKSRKSSWIQESHHLPLDEASVPLV